MKCTEKQRLSLQFQPTLPVRGVTEQVRRYYTNYIFQPTLPVRGVTGHSGHGVLVALISTHTPRAGSDNEPMIEGEGEEITTHTPPAGSDAK